MYTRRDFAKFALAGVPVTMALGAKINSTVKGVRLGNSTYSYRDLPRTPGTDNVDAVIDAMKTNGVGEIELFNANVEPASATSARPPSRPPGGPPADPEARAAAMRARMNSPEAKKAREDLRQWRLATSMDYFKTIGKKFSDAGIQIDAYTINYRDHFTDDEIEKTFEQAKALGTKQSATSTQA